MSDCLCFVIKKIKELPPLLIVKILRNSHASGQINYIKQYVIKNLGGPILQQECSQKYPKGVRYGEVAVTSGGLLQCQIVCHGSLDQWRSRYRYHFIKRNLFLPFYI
jgi:hypothetical protein